MRYPIPAAAAALTLLLAVPARADDSVIVKFRGSVSAAKRSKLARAAGAGRTLGVVRGQGARVLSAPAADAVAARLNRSSAVLYAEPNARLHALADPGDP